jgi:hypothetical protein
MRSTIEAPGSVEELEMGAPTSDDSPVTGLVVVRDRADDPGADGSGLSAERTWWLGGPGKNYGLRPRRQPQWRERRWGA